MKILLTTTYYLPNVSGITIYVQILAEELVKKGHEVTILTSRHDKNTKKTDSINGVKIRRIPVWFYIGKGPVCPSFLFWSIEEILKNEVINCHLPQPESLWITIWSRMLRKKIFLTQHTDLSFWPGVKNKIIDGSVFVCQFLAAKLATRIITYTSDYAKNSYFLKHFLAKTEEVYPPIRLTFKEDKKLSRKIKKNTENKKYVIGFCGRIAKQKGIELLIKSTRLLESKLGNNFVILMAGPKKVVGENYYDYLYSRYKNIIDKRFVFLGNIKRDSLGEFYKRIDLLVLPSDDRLESFGWVQIEAMHGGTPVVSTSLPGMRIPILKTSFGELFERDNANDLADKLLMVLTKGKNHYQKKLGDKLKIFDYHRSINKCEKILTGCLF